jgi:hypothetical protein
MSLLGQFLGWGFCIMFKSKLEIAEFIIFLIIGIFGMASIFHIMGYDIFTGTNISNN